MSLTSLLPMLLLLLCCCQGYDSRINYWEAFAPGKLLQRLDALTEAATAGRALPQPLPAVETPTPLPTSLPTTKARRKADAEHYDEQDGLSAELSGEVDGEVDGDVDGDANAGSEDDYERNYEQFVREYFARAPEESSESELETELGTDDVSLYSGSVESSQVDYEPAPSNVKGSKQRKGSKQSKQRCQRVRRQGQLCEICRQPRNNAVSETCSYAHEAQPQQYVYGSGTKYKRYKEQPAEEEDQSASTSVEQRKSVKRASQSAPSSLCVRRLHKQRICYDCRDSDGERLRRCYDAPAEAEQQPRKLKQQQTHNAAQEQRIYKRTVSYEYAQGSDQDQDQDNSTTSTPNATATEALAATPALRQRRRTVVKMLHSKRRRGL